MRHEAGDSPPRRHSADRSMEIVIAFAAGVLAMVIYRWVCPVQVFRQGFKEIGLDYGRQLQERET